MKIDLGCGNAKKKGFVGIDINKYKNVDIVYDLNKGIPIPNNNVDEVNCSHIIEHIDNADFFLREIYRVCKPNALVVIRSPYYSYKFSMNPGHRNTYCDDWFKEVIENFYNDLFEIIKIEYKECQDIREELRQYEINFEFAKKHLNNIIEEFTIFLRIKKSCPRIAFLSESDRKSVV